MSTKCQSVFKLNVKWSHKRPKSESAQKWKRKSRNEIESVCDSTDDASAWAHIVCTLGWFNLKSISSFAVKRPKIPRKAIYNTSSWEANWQLQVKVPSQVWQREQCLCNSSLINHHGGGGSVTVPTTARAEGREKSPLLTISAIISKLTNLRYMDVDEIWLNGS